MLHSISKRDSEPTAFWRTRYAAGLVVLAAVAAYFLLSEHRAHFFIALPFLLLLVCPLTHVFMHHGHSSHAGGRNHNDDDKPGANTSATSSSNTEATP